MSRRYQAAILTASYNGLQVPNAPTIGTATAGSGSASVTFTAPSNVGGGAITSYTVISSPGSILGTGSSSPVTVSGLTNGTAYTFTVVATNAYGSGPASAASNSVTPAVNYIENVFSTWLYTGTGAALTITNGIDLSGKGGLVWFKNRNSTNNHALYDTARGATKRLSTSQTGGTGAQVTDPTSLTAFNSNGFSIGSDNSQNENTFTFASWTFREQAKFFDVVTYTGNGTAGRTVAHDLGSVPGCIIVKQTSASGQDWMVYHRSLATNDYILLNSTGAASTYPYISSPTSTTFTVESAAPVNSNGATYVAYLFAHDAGGFGTSGTDNVISCGSFVGTGSDLSVNLGYEPQWLLVKRASSGTENWAVYDNMRGMFVNYDDNILFPNTSGAEVQVSRIAPTATGFNVASGYPASGTTYIYIAIRRGPMKVPTSGTSVFSPYLYTPTGTNNRTLTGFGFNPDLTLWASRNRASYSDTVAIDRLRGTTGTGGAAGGGLATNTTAAEYGNAVYQISALGSNSVTFGSDSQYGFNNTSINSAILWTFGRAPSFFDEVCYTGTGVATTVTHNLGAVPELIIVKKRNTGGNDWYVYSQPTGNQYATYLNLTYQGDSGSSVWNNTSPTSSVFSLGASGGINGSGSTFVAYLFATCAGVSKVGSYTGTGALQTINCAFTTGARFVLIKRTDSTGDWYTYDSARGITSGNDPYLFLNSTAAEVTGTNYVDSTAAGFQVTAAAPAGLNAVGGTYIFLAIA